MQGAFYARPNDCVIAGLFVCVTGDLPVHVTNGLAGFIVIFIIIYKLIPAIFALVFMIRGKIHLKQLLLPVEEKLSNYFYFLLFFLPLIYSILTLLNTNTGCCGDWQWHFGLIAFITGWANLINLTSKFPFIGQQSIVYFTIVCTFLKLSIFGLLLLLASAIVLMAVFFNPQAVVSASTYQSCTDYSS